MTMVDPPRNGEYLVAAYVIASTILAGYWGVLWRRAKQLSGNGKKRER